MLPQLRRALLKDEDGDVKRWSAVAIARLGPDPETDAVGAPITDAMLREPSVPLRVAAALAFAEHGDARGEGELLARWEAAFVPAAKTPGELEEARELLAALAKVRARSAAPVLVRSLADVRLRPFVVETLGEIGDPRAQPALLATFTTERYVDVRPKEARALVKVGARDVLLAPLRRFAGVPDPMVEALEVARAAGLLTTANGGWRPPPKSEVAPGTVDARVDVEGSGPARILVAGAADGGIAALVDGAKVPLVQRGPIRVAELPNAGPKVRVVLSSTAGIHAFWVVRRAPEIPPPPPREWQAGDGGLDGGPEGGPKP